MSYSSSTAYNLSLGTWSYTFLRSTVQSMYTPLRYIPTISQKLSEEFSTFNLIFSISCLTRFEAVIKLAFKFLTLANCKTCLECCFKSYLIASTISGDFAIAVL